MNTVKNIVVTSWEVNRLEHLKEQEKRKRSRNLVRIFFISVMFLAFITGAILIALIRKYNIDFQRQQAKETAQIFCSMTEHFTACLSSISSPITTTSRQKWTGPDEIFVLSLQLAVEQLSNLTSLTKSLISNLADHQSRSDLASLQQCTNLIHDSLDRLNRSLTTSAGVLLFSLTTEKESLAREKIDYLMPKVNDSVSDLSTCFQLLVKVESMGVNEVSGRVRSAMVDAGMAFDFLQNREVIKDRLQFLNWSSGSDVKFEYLTTLLMSFPQYLILVLLGRNHNLSK